MFLRVLLAVFVVVLVRFLLGLFRELGRPGSGAGGPRVRKGAGRDPEPPSGRVIDVDYTEHPDGARDKR